MNLVNGDGYKESKFLCVVVASGACIRCRLAYLVVHSQSIGDEDQRGEGLSNQTKAQQMPLLIVT